MRKIKLQELTTLERQSRESKFQAQMLQARMETEKKLLNDTINRMRGIQKELERAKDEAQKQKFEKVVDEMSDGVAVCGPDWNIININPSALKYLRLLATDNVNLLDFIFDNYIVSVAKGKLDNLSWSHRTFDIVRKETEKFKELYLETTLSVVKDSQFDQVSNIILTMRDVTQTRKEELMKRDFLSFISHKLLTPITIINGNARLLKDFAAGPVNDKQAGLINAILTQSGVFSNLVEKLIAFTTLENQKLDMEKEKIAIKAYLPALVERVVAKSTDKKVELNINCIDANAPISMNKTYFDILITNLIENAIKFNDKDIIRIDVNAQISNERIEISISDNGIGIPAEESENIFTKFYQVEKYFTGNAQGIGIGLAIVKRIAYALGGDIKFNSDIGKGSKFILTLPS